MVLFSAAPSTTPRLPTMQRYRASAFHQIDVSFPGLRLVSEEPFIFVVDGFLSSDEADQLAEKMAAAPDARPSSEKLLQLGDRDSTSVILRNDEVPGLRHRIAKLARCQLAQMPPLKISRYEPGGVFRRHTDCTRSLGVGDGQKASASDAARYPNRFCTVLLYLNDVKRGGRTRWLWTASDPGFYRRLDAGRPERMLQRALRSVVGDEPTPTDGVSIAPRKGTAVVHFPCTSPSEGLLLDPNAEHESEPALDPKLVCQQFIWSAPMDAPPVDERLRGQFADLVREQPAEPLSGAVL